MTRVASFHLGDFRTRRAISKMVALPAERWELASTPGCVLGKVLGTSRKGTTKMSVEIGRWAMFAVWEDSAALRNFVDQSPIVRRWERNAASVSHFELEPFSSKGEWSGMDPFPDLGIAGRKDPPEGRIAVLTHANIRPTKALAFLKAVPAVDEVLFRQPGNELALGIGEWPLLQQATFSIWDSNDSLTQFAYRGDQHREAMRRAHQEGWFTEELFARFGVSEI